VHYALRTPHGPHKASGRPARHRHITCTCWRTLSLRDRRRLRWLSGLQRATGAGIAHADTDHGARSANTVHRRSERGAAGGQEPPWTDHGYIATSAPKATTERGDPWSTHTQPTNSSIRMEPSLRPSLEADAPSLTRAGPEAISGAFSLMENALKVASGGPGAGHRAGHRAGAGGWFEAVRVGGMGRPEIPPAGVGWGLTRSHRDRPGRCSVRCSSGRDKDKPRQ
jgi:hypothetical protein